MRRNGRSNADWQTHEVPNFTWEQVLAELLMDIREELRQINGTLRCQQTQRIPRYLARIASNTAKPKKEKK